MAMSWYLRFQCWEQCSGTRWPYGVFGARSKLHRQRSGVVECDEWISEVFSWFDVNLRVPPASELDSRAVFWFVPAASEFVSAAWTLAAAYRSAGIAMSLQ